MSDRESWEVSDRESWKVSDRESWEVGDTDGGGRRKGRAVSDTPGTAILGTNSGCPVFVPPLEPLGELLLDGPVGAGPSVQVKNLLPLTGTASSASEAIVGGGGEGVCASRESFRGVWREPGRCQRRSVVEGRKGRGRRFGGLN